MRKPQHAVALAYGLTCHMLFAAAVGVMILALYTGLSRGLGTLRGAPGWLANTALVLQFPLVHSFLLSRAGRRLLQRVTPLGLGQPLSSTTYAIVASLQILLALGSGLPRAFFSGKPAATPRR